jgi:hypothetical protein
LLLHGLATPKRRAVTASDPASGFTASVFKEVASQVLLVQHHHINFPRLDQLALQAD